MKELELKETTIGIKEKQRPNYGSARGRLLSEKLIEAQKINSFYFQCSSGSTACTSIERR